MKNWRVELRAGGKRLAKVKNLERYIPGRCVIIITICENSDATQSHS